MQIDRSQMTAVIVVFAPMVAMVVDMFFHRRELKKLRKKQTQQRRST